MIVGIPLSGPVKAGLLCGLSGGVVLVGWFVLSFGSALCAGPIIAALTGACAGSFGVHWSTAQQRIGPGVLAGLVAGGCLLASLVLFFIGFALMTWQDPRFLQGFLEGLGPVAATWAAQPATAGVLLFATSALLGLCFGLVHLLIAVMLSLVGSWIRTRQATITAPHQA